MSGGPSQTDTFDPKPGHANSGPFKPIETTVPGMLLGAHLPKLAKQVKDLAVIRSMSSKEGDHGRATYYLRTGYLPMGPIRYPTLGSLVANELGDDSAELPGFVSISPVRAINPAAFTRAFWARNTPRWSSASETWPAAWIGGEFVATGRRSGHSPGNRPTRGPTTGSS